MASLFVSHSSRDRALVEALRDWLAAQGYGALFVDFDPQLGIPAGRNWERELYSQLRKADAVLLVLTADAAQSRWCFAEVALARSLGKPVIALRTDPTVRMSLVGDTQGVNFMGDAASFADLGERLARSGLGAERSFAWSTQRDPYPGLAPFSAEDAAVFFGRDHEIARLLEMLQPTLQRGPGRFVAIVGPSGSGKSSLLRAGLIPRLQRRPGRWVVLPPLLPGQWPTENLARCLHAALRTEGADRPLRDRMSALASGPEHLVEIVRELAGAAGERTVLLPIDQAEELVTRAGPDEQRAFLTLIHGALVREPDLWVVATLRSEFLSSDIERAGVAGVIDETLLVEPVTRERLAEVILGPARRAGIEFAPGLAERMAVDAGGGDALPMLQVTLQALYEGAGADSTITVADYERVGGVEGALRRRADGVLAELTKRGLDAAVVPLLLRLVVVEAGGEVTSRRLPHSVLTTDQRAAAAAFVEARLLTSAVADDGTATVAIAHEALVRSWPVAAQAVAESRDVLRLRSELERHAADWRAAGRDDAYLLRGRRLARYDGLGADGQDDLDTPTREYLEAGRAHAVEELAVARRSNRRLRVLATGLATAVVLVAVAGVLAVVRGREAQRQARLTAAGLLGARADSVVDRQPDLAIALGLQALDLAGDGGVPSPGLVSGMARVAHATRVVARSSDQVHAVGVSPDGALLAFAGWDKAVHLVDPASGKPTGEPMTGHRDVIMTMAFSPDGARIASAGADRGVRLWDPVTRRRQGRPLAGHDAMISAVAFTPDGRRLASADIDGTVLLWDTARQARVGPALRAGPQVWALAFSPDGGTLAIGREREVVIWEIGTPVDDGAAIDVPGVVQGLAFAPDGSALAAGTAEGADLTEGSVHVWQWPSRRPQTAMPDVHRSVVRSVAYSRDGGLLASAGDDGAVQLYDAGSLQVYPQPLAGHTNVVKAVAFGPDGRELFSAGWDGAVRAFATAPTYSVRRPLSGEARAVADVAVADDGTTASAGGGEVVFHDRSGRQVGPPLEAHRTAVTAVSLSPDGDLLATAASDGLVGVWDTRRRRRIGEGIASGGREVLDVALHPDGRQVAVGGWEGARVFDLAAPNAPPVDLVGHVERVHAVAYSPDGAHLATASADQRVILRSRDQVDGVQVFRDHRGEARDVAFGPRGGALASVGDDGTLAVHDVPSGRRRFLVAAGPGALHTVAFSRDGARVAAAGADGTAWVWSATTGRRIGHVLSGHHADISTVAFGPGGGVLITAGDGLWRWDLGFDQWSIGCDLANRDLTAREWSDLVAGRPYERACP